MSALDLPAASAARPSRPVSTRFLFSELRLVFGRRRNQVVLAVLAAIPILIAVAVKVSAPKPGSGPAFFDDVTSNGLFVSLAALIVVLPIFLPLAMAVVAGDAVAGEAGAGTLRYLLVTPVSRGRLLAVKYASLVVFALAATLLVAVVGALAGIAAFGTGRVVLLSGAAVSLPEALLRILAMCLYSAVQMAAFGALGLFVTVLVSSPVAAMAGTAGIAVVLQVLDQVPQLNAIHPYLINDHWLAIGDLLRSPVPTGALWTGVGVAAAYLAMGLSLAWACFAGRDVSS